MRASSGGGGGRGGQGGGLQRRGGRGGRGGFSGGSGLAPPVGVAGFPDGLFGVGRRAGGEGVLQDVIEAEGSGFFGGGGGDQVKGTAGAGHGDIQQAEFSEGLGAAVGGVLRGQRRFGFDDVCFGRGENPVHGGDGIATVLFADEQGGLAPGQNAVASKRGQNLLQ